MKAPGAELGQLIDMARRDAPAVTLASVVDQLEAFTRDNPDDQVSRQARNVGRSIAAAASKDTAAAWADVELQVRLLRTITGGKNDGTD